MRTLRRTGFAATLVTGLLLTASAVNGVSSMDTTLQLAANAPERPVFVSHEARPAPGPAWGGCDRAREHREHRDDRLT
jgi:hypothetical protein